VGCDGAHSIVQSALTNTRTSLVETAASLRSYYKNVKGIKQDCFEFYFIPNLNKGYFWIFPSTNGLANVGIGGIKDKKATRQFNLRKVFYYLINESPQFKNRFEDAELVGEEKGWSIPLDLFNSKLPISGSRILLCGDAAALADPITAEGIAPAMSSGRFAAWQIKKCFRKNDFSASIMKSYDKEIRKKYFKDYYFKSALIKLLNRFPGLIDLIFGVAGKS
jgi:menaquinone-9 beta-reductase